MATRKKSSERPKKEFPIQIVAHSHTMLHSMERREHLSMILEATVFDIESVNMMEITIPSKGLMKHRKKLHGIMPSGLPLNKTHLDYMANLWEYSTSEIMSRVHSIVSSGFGIETFKRRLALGKEKLLSISQTSLNHYSDIQQRLILRQSLVNKTLNNPIMNDTTVLFSIIQCKNILPKDVGKKNSHPYCIVYHGSKAYISHSVENDCHASFIFQVCLDLTIDQPILVTLWNRSSKTNASPKDDSFLGMVTFESNDLINHLSQHLIMDETYPLGKRSIRSHVAGQLRIQCQPSLVTFPKSDGKAIVKEFMMRALAFELIQVSFSLDSMGYSELAINIIHQLLVYYSLDPVWKTILFIDVLFDGFQKGTIGLQLFCECYLHHLEPLLNKNLTSIETQALHSLTMAIADKLVGRLKYFLSDKQRKSSIIELKQGKIIKPAETRDSIYMSILCDTLEHSWKHQYLLLNQDFWTFVKQTLTEALNNRYHGLIGISGGEIADSTTSLVKLVDLTLKELEFYQESYSALISERIHLPSLACRLFYENILKDLDEFSKTYSPYEHNLETVFQLYHGVHRLAAIVEQIDFQIADGFKIEEWFYPFLKEWMALSDQKLLEWMRNAVSIDQWNPLANDQLYSSSAHDLFTFLQHQLEFLVELKWPNASQNMQFLIQYYEIVIFIIEQYAFSLKRLLAEELDRLCQQEEIEDKKETYDRLVVSMQAAMKLCDIYYVLQKFPEMSRKIQTFSTSDSVLEDTKYFLRLWILHGHDLPLARQLSTKVSCGITIRRKDGLETFASIKVPQSRDPIWIKDPSQITRSQAIHVCATERDMTTLDLLFYQLIPGKKEYASLRTPLCHPLNAELKKSDEGQVQVDFRMGSVAIGYERERRNPIQFLTGRAKYILTQTLDEMSHEFVLSICSGFTSQIKKISKKFKDNPIKNVMRKIVKQKKSLEKVQGTLLVDPDEVEQRLAEVFAFFNHNFQILMDYLPSELCMGIISDVWLRIVEQMAFLVVGDINEQGDGMINMNNGSKAMWNQRRVDFMKIASQFLALFFQADGNGLTKTSVETRAYLNLLTMLDWHSFSQQELILKYQELRNALGKEVDLLWLLKLIALKGGSEFLENELRRM